MEIRIDFNWPDDASKIIHTVTIVRSLADWTLCTLDEGNISEEVHSPSSFHLNLDGWAFNNGQGELPVGSTCETEPNVCRNLAEAAPHILVVCDISDHCADGMKN